MLEVLWSSNHKVSFGQKFFISLFSASSRMTFPGIHPAWNQSILRWTSPTNVSSKNFESRLSLNLYCIRKILHSKMYSNLRTYTPSGCTWGSISFMVNHNWCSALAHFEKGAVQLSCWDSKHAHSPHSSNFSVNSDSLFMDSKCYLVLTSFINALIFSCELSYPSFPSSSWTCSFLPKRYL